MASDRFSRKISESWRYLATISKGFLWLEGQVFLFTLAPCSMGSSGQKSRFLFVEKSDFETQSVCHKWSRMFWLSVSADTRCTRDVASTSTSVHMYVYRLLHLCFCFDLFIKKITPWSYTLYVSVAISTYISWTHSELFRSCTESYLTQRTEISSRLSNYIFLEQDYNSRCGITFGISRIEGFATSIENFLRLQLKKII